MEDIVFQLTKPITHGTKEITELVFREPTAKDIIDMQKGEDTLSQQLLLMSSLSQIPSPVIAKMRAIDFLAAGKALSPFLGEITEG